MTLETEVEYNPSRMNVAPVALEEYNIWRIPVLSSILKKEEISEGDLLYSRLSYALRNERVSVGRGVAPAACHG